MLDVHRVSNFQPFCTGGAISVNRRPDPLVNGPRKCQAFWPQSLGQGRSSPAPREDSCPKPVLEAAPWLTPALNQSGTEFPSGSCPEDQALEARARIRVTWMEEGPPQQAWALRPQPHRTGRLCLKRTDFGPSAVCFGFTVYARALRQQ